MKYHLRFKNIHPKVLDVTNDFMGKRGGPNPWTGTPDEKQVRYELWLELVSDVYGVPKPELHVLPGHPQLEQARGTYSGNAVEQHIWMATYSVMTLFHEYRHHLQFHGKYTAAEDEDVPVMEQLETDARGWSASLFYATRPMLFRRSVRQGKILFMHPKDLLIDPEAWIPPRCEACTREMTYVGNRSERCGHDTCWHCEVCLDPMCTLNPNPETRRFAQEFNEIITANNLSALDDEDGEEFA